MRPFACFAIFVLLAWSEAIACEPIPATQESVAAAFTRASAVFLGTVTDLRERTSDQPAARSAQIRFKVDRVYKGEPREADTYLTALRTVVFCGYWEPTLGERVIVFVKTYARGHWASQPYRLGDDQAMLAAALQFLKNGAAELLR